MATDNISIHPHVYHYGQRLRPAPSTAGKPSRWKLERALRGLEEHFERHPRDAMTAQRIMNLKLRIKEMPKAAAAKQREAMGELPMAAE